MIIQRRICQSGVAKSPSRVFFSRRRCLFSESLDVQDATGRGPRGLKNSPAASPRALPVGRPFRLPVPFPPSVGPRSTHVPRLLSIQAIVACGSFAVGLESLPSPQSAPPPLVRPTITGFNSAKFMEG